MAELTDRIGASKRSTLYLCKSGKSLVNDESKLVADLPIRETSYFAAPYGLFATTYGVNRVIVSVSFLSGGRNGV